MFSLDYVFKSPKVQVLELLKRPLTDQLCRQTFSTKIGLPPPKSFPTIIQFLLTHFKTIERKKLQRIKIFHTFVAKNVLVCKELCMHTRLAL